jgi:hypothetical protein
MVIAARRGKPNGAEWLAGCRSEKKPAACRSRLRSVVALVTAAEKAEAPSEPKCLKCR